MKKVYLNPVTEVVSLNLKGNLLVGSSFVPGEEGGENSGKETTTDEGLDDLLG